MTGKWTPGPWEARFRFGRKTTVAGRQRFPICDTSTAPLAESNTQRDEANAQLIAASPAMADALERLMGRLCGDSMSDQDRRDAYEIAERALSQALGEGT